MGLLACSIYCHDNEHQKQVEAGRGSLVITDEIAAVLRNATVDAGITHIFVRHTSCGLAITENADASVRHDLEGDDDMAAHARSLLTGVSLTVPFASGRLLLGTWQGIYLFEHRTQGHSREIVVTLIG